MINNRHITAMTSNFLLMLIVLFFIQCSGHSSGNSSEANLDSKTDTMKQTDYTPGYIELHKQNELKKRGDSLWERMSQCDLCPRQCGANRLEGERGECNANSDLEIASVAPHFGEEPELVGESGSGTIFLTNCGLKCVFCINADISQEDHGSIYSIDEFARMMLALQDKGCHNINLVTPSHYSPHILLALDKAAEQGLRIPLVYNTCGYEKTKVLKVLDGVVDIYLSDFKYGCNEQAGQYSPGASDYVEYAQKAHLEMYRQTGTATIYPETGLMQKGLMIRHLVMPNDAACTENIMGWIADNLPENTYINIMRQYTPVYHAGDYPEIDRRITQKEYKNAVQSAKRHGLINIKTQ
jgi:putative pyruvate formate lyase activating enzyme